MWTRKNLKDRGKRAFKRNYWKSVLVGLVLILISGGIGLTHSIDKDDVRDFKRGFREGIGVETQYDSSHSDKYKVDSDLDLNRETTAILVIVIIVVALVVFLIIFTIGFFFAAILLNPLMMGVQRFFFKNLTEEAKVKELAYGYDHNYKNVVKILFFRDLYTVLWTLLLIVPGIVKSYEYRMISYLLAENPNMSKEEAFAVSKQMMNGNKWKVFVLDLSFLGWHILGILTLGIVEIFYVRPYEGCTDAALYEVLRYGGPRPDNYNPHFNGYNPVNSSMQSNGMN